MRSVRWNGEEVNVAVITPTYRYGGLGEQFACLQRQSHRIQTWIIADDLYEQRADLVKFKTAGANFEVVHFEPDPKPAGYFSNLAGIYNMMLDRAEFSEAELIVSLQDHFWIPKDGIARFVAATVLHPNDLVTGLASIAKQPGPELVTHPDGMWTLFDEVYDLPPGPDMWWEDVRKDYYPGEGALCRANPVEWELNWASVPGRHVKAGTRFDPEYGRGIAIENQDFAWQCFLDHDAMVILDKENHALGFNHKRYWPEQEQEGLPMTEINKEYHNRKWGNVLNIVNMGRF